MTYKPPGRRPNRRPAANRANVRHLTPAQRAALARLQADGVVYCYTGVSVVTAQALADQGLAELATSVRVYTTPGGRTKSERQWTLTPTERGMNR